MSYLKEARLILGGAELRAVEATGVSLQEFASVAFREAVSEVLADQEKVEAKAKRKQEKEEEEASAVEASEETPEPEAETPEEKTKAKKE